MCFVPLIALFKSRRPNAIEFCDAEGKRLTRLSKGTPVPIDGTFSTKQGTALSKILIRRLEPGQTLELWSESVNIKIHSSSFLLAEKEPIVVKVQGDKQKERVCNLEVTRSGISKKPVMFQKYSLYYERRHVAESEEEANSE